MGGIAVMIGVMAGALMIVYGRYFLRTNRSSYSAWVLVFYAVIAVASWVAITAQKQVVGALEVDGGVFSGSTAAVVASLIYSIFVFRTRAAKSPEGGGSLTRALGAAWFGFYIFVGLAVLGFLVSIKITEWMMGL